MSRKLSFKTENKIQTCPGEQGCFIIEIETLRQTYIY